MCKKNGVQRLDLFGSFATGTQTPTSDIDFVVYGCKDLLKLERDLESIDTLRKIDIFDYDSIKNPFLTLVVMRLQLKNANSIIHTFKN